MDIQLLNSVIVVQFWIAATEQRSHVVGGLDRPRILVLMGVAVTRHFRFFSIVLQDIGSQYF